MKKEARVSASACLGDLCAAVVVRLGSVDGIAISLCGCENLCRRLKDTGYLGEVRYYLGPCGCGATRLQQNFAKMYGWAEEFAKRIVEGLHDLAAERPELLTCSGDVSSGAGVPEPGQRGRA